MALSKRKKKDIKTGILAISIFLLPAAASLAYDTIRTKILKKSYVQRDVYASKEDCMSDWGGDVSSCEDSDQNQNGQRRFYGPRYSEYDVQKKQDKNKDYKPTTVGSRKVDVEYFDVKSGVKINTGDVTARRGGFGKSASSISSSKS